MCILMNDDDDHHNSATTSLDNSSKRDGRKRWQFHTHHSWIIPKRPLLLVLAMALFMLVMGMLFMAIGAGIASVGLRVVGGLLFGFGLIGLIICFVITVHAYFFYGTRDQSTQTTDAPWTDEMTLDAAGYSSVGRPSALKSPDSTLKRNGTLGVKKVTLAPELGDYGVLPLNNSVNNNNSNNMSNNNNHNTNNVIGGGNVGGVGSGGKANTINIVSNQQPLHRLPSTGSGNTSRANSMPRSGYVDGSTVGTGGIKITPLDPNSSQPSPASSISYGGSASQYYSTGGGGSTISGGSVNDTYAYPRSVQLSFDSGNSGSHYSTLRSIPVTHLGPGQKPSTSSYREVEYATVNKSGGLNKPVNTSVHVEHVPASQHQQQQQFQQHGGNSVSSQSQGLVTHVQMGQDKVGGASQRLVQDEDDRYKDYDNTPEPTPIIVTSVSPHPQIHQQQHQQQQHQQQAHGGNATYHEQQMQFQRHQRNHSQSQNQQQQDLHAPRQVNAYSHHRQYAPNPFTFQQQSQQQQQQEQQVQQYKMHYEQEKKQQQQQIQSQQSKSSAASSARNSMVDDVFEPQPLVYPSARRPMTFDKVTSSKMSVYDNVLANNLKESDEVEASG